MKKLTLKTSLISSILSKINRGVSNDKAFPITSLIGLFYKDKTLYFRSTDKRNELQIKVDNVDYDEDFSIAINANMLVNLVGKLSSENVSFTIDNKTLIVVADGTYKIPIETDAEGFVTFDYINVEETDKVCTLEADTLKSVFELNNAILSKKNIYPEVLENYCFADSVLASDGDLICSTDRDILQGSKALVNLSTVNLLQQFTGKVAAYIKTDCIYFVAENMLMKSTVQSDVSEYPIEESTDFVKTSIDSVCVVQRGLLCSTLDRMSLFLDSFMDAGDITLEFTEKALRVSSVQSSAVEEIVYNGVTDHKDFTCYISLVSLKKALDNWPKDTVVIRYGNDSLILLEADDTTLAIGLSNHQEAIV